MIFSVIVELQTLRMFVCSSSDHVVKCGALLIELDISGWGQRPAGGGGSIVNQIQTRLRHCPALHNITRSTTSRMLSFVDQISRLDNSYCGCRSYPQASVVSSCHRSSCPRCPRTWAARCSCLSPSPPHSWSWTKEVLIEFSCPSSKIPTIVHFNKWFWFDLKRRKLVDNFDKIYYFLFELQSDLALFVEGRMASNIFQSGVL